MPIYEYQCQSCEHEFEAIQKMSDPLLSECPACHEQALRKKVSAAAFRLKGSGWYETDFKTGKKKNVLGETSESSSPGKESGTKESKSDSTKSEPSKSTASSPAASTN